ncbi:MAG TPA: alpha/beta hydrolase [Acidimicrobiales bacterium]|nr:alpha/beta hydrolase [Acidimicrobiales bacterium]
MAIARRPRWTSPVGSTLVALVALASLDATASTAGAATGSTASGPARTGASRSDSAASRAAESRSPAPEASGPGGQQATFEAVIRQITALPYQAAYVPQGYDSAFPAGTVLNDLPAEDYTSGSIPGGPDSPVYPPLFHEVLLHSADGASFYAEVALQPGRRPGIEVVPGFNTHSDQSVVRWAAMLAANGYDVIAADQRDFAAEYDAGYGYPSYPQTFGWKESQDVVAAGRYLATQQGVGPLGIVGFSEGGQDSILAMADAPGLYAAGLTFSGPADQDTQIYSTAEPAGCQTPACSYPATDALVALVVPPYSDSDVCTALSEAATYYGTTGFDILARESAFHAQTSIGVPLLNFYSEDDSLVPPFEASMMAGYEAGAPLQRTMLLAHGEHAYFFDRWWQQTAILDYFKALLPGARSAADITAQATVNQTPGGAPLSDQLVSLGEPDRAEADSYLAPYVCDTAEGTPGA